MMEITGISMICREGVTFKQYKAIYQKTNFARKRIIIIPNMNILSLFDGMSCGQIALRELGIKVDNYFASEIDKYAIEQTQLNFPNTIHLGDATKVKAADLPPIDLLIGGSPCQGFSFAGKQLNFTDPRSVLFFEYVRILKELREINPNIKFLLENVRMRKEFEAVISAQLGLQPVMINSALVSAQNRVRLYWTNIRTRTEGLFSDVYTDIPQPQDKGLLLRDILEPNAPERYYLSEKTVANMLKHKERQREAGNGFGMDIRQPQDKWCAVTIGGKMTRDLIEEPNKSAEHLNKNLKETTDKANCFLATSYKGAWANGTTLVQEPTCVVIRGREACLSPKRTEYGKAIRKDYEAGKIDERRKNIQQLEPRTDNKTNTLTTVQKDNLILVPVIYQRPRGENKGGVILDKTPTLTANAWEQNNLVVSGTFQTHKDDFGFREIKSGKGATIPARAREDGSGQNFCKIGNRIRRLTPLECSRLQTIPSWYNWGCSETQTYKMLGNGWTVEVIKHIFQYLER